MSTQSVRMVVFDIGGVLVRICRTWPEACARAGVPVRAGWDDGALRGLREELSREYQLGGMETGEYCARLAATAPGLYSAAEVRRVHDAWIVDEYAGVIDLIDDLHGAGMATGVLSNTNAAHWERLAGAPAPHGRSAEFTAPGRVQHLHASHLLRAAKPALESFRAFEARARVESGIVFFDDLEENIAGARAAGWTGVLVDHRGDTAAQMRRELRGMGVL